MNGFDECQLSIVDFVRTGQQVSFTKLIIRSPLIMARMHDGRSLIGRSASLRALP
jgi:hypothetical protein